MIDNELKVDPTDSEFEDDIIATVEPDGGGWAIGRANGWSFYVPETSPVTPKVGDAIRFYGRGIGYPVRGLTINGATVFYRTREQHRLDQEQEQERSDQRRRAQFEQQRSEHDQRITALPAVMRERIAKFQAFSPDWRWQHEGYELFTCEQAVLIADALKTPDAVAEFQKEAWDEQKRIVAGLSDGHSGNTFDAACFLAKCLLTDPALVTQAHGALATLVGCKEYGCH